MKHLLYLVAAIMGAATITVTTSCHFVPSQQDGDTVAASEFYPIEPTATPHHQKGGKGDSIQSTIKDSIGIYYIGSGSTHSQIQLVSYPSRRDTFLYSKTRHVKVKGCADIDHVVSVQFYLLNGKDSLVKYVEEKVKSEE